MVNTFLINFCVEKRHSHVHLHTPLKPHSHHHGKKEKTKKGPKKKRHDDKPRQPERKRSPLAEEDGVSAISDSHEEKVEKNIVDQTISVLPEIGEDEILATPPKQGWLSEMAVTSTPPVNEEALAIQAVETLKEASPVGHKQKHDGNEKKDLTSSKSGHHHKHRRHRYRSELHERRRPGVATIKEKDKELVHVHEPSADGSALDQKDVEDMKCRFLVVL